MAGLHGGEGGGAQAGHPAHQVEVEEVTTGQAELLNQDLQELRAALHEARSRNIYLADLLEKQKQ